ncbi:PHB depolymerase family esterase [Dyadobacter sp. CY356]|uniref:alpha/beta hydrolase family esterase n=1 Tax=Dyadobacter sp. CY356 TaxID=2906442 RepID=UPI001F2C756D|nr:poly(3-hydroxybutyrate) depolymerase [Dyadobacter sp. CY356]MCF0057043.1 poly(3-hydroxybutyrate) depolymerase [Dyadobacter sp. CY356]
MLKNLFITIILLQCSLVRAQLVADSLLIDNHYRVFYYNKPQPTQTGASLIFAMHGSGGKPQDMVEKAVTLEKRAVADNFIIAYPAGYKHYWNECRKASTAAANVENINEPAFFSGMIKYFNERFRINEKQVFATGFSGGGHMSYSLGITMPDKIKAISAVVANLPTPENMDCVESKKPLAVMITNGTADQTNPYNGGEVKTPGVSLGTVRATEQSFQYWAALDGYKGDPVKTIVQDADTSNDITIEKYTYQKKGKPEVTLLKVINGKHQWLTDIDVFEESWKFFKRQME